MARYYVLAKLPLDKIDAGNAQLASIIGDDPGTIEFTANASANGSAPASHAVSNANVSEGEKNAWVNWLAGQEGCDSKVYPTSANPDFWSEAWNWWGLQQVSG